MVYIQGVAVRYREDIVRAERAQSCMRHMRDSMACVCIRCLRWCGCLLGVGVGVCLKQYKYVLAFGSCCSSLWCCCLVRVAACTGVGVSISVAICFGVAVLLEVLVVPAGVCLAFSTKDLLILPLAPLSLRFVFSLSSRSLLFLFAFSSLSLRVL